MKNLKIIAVSAAATFVKAFVAQATLAGLGVGGVIDTSAAQRSVVAGGVAVLEFASALATGWLAKHPAKDAGQSNAATVALIVVAVVALLWAFGYVPFTR